MGGLFVLLGLESRYPGTPKTPQAFSQGIACRDMDECKCGAIPRV